jgi:hypothetical protein
MLLVLLFLTSSFLIAFPVQAESKKIVVPDDYPTISEAIRNAEDGDTIFVKKGTYEEKTLEIKKTLSLVGEGAEFTKINLDPPLYSSPPDILNRTSSWFGPAITVDANDFKLLGFTINTPGTSDKAGGGIIITGNRTQIVDNNINARVSVNGFNTNIAENTLLGDINMFSSYSIFTENNFSGVIRAFGSYLNISTNKKASSNKVGTADSGIRLEGSFCLVYGNILTAKDLDPGIGVGGDKNVIASNILDGSDVGITFLFQVLHRLFLE